MLYISRLIITVIHSILVYVFGSIYCFFNPRSLERVATLRHTFGRLAPFSSLKVECHKSADAESYGNAICIANYQNSYDTVTVSDIVQPPIVTVGRESLLWISFFEQLYWLTGNLLINRNSRTRAHSIIAEVVNHFRKRRTSIWMFPEGTCNRSHDLLPSKTGAFHATITADVLIIPVCVSTTSNKVNLNRLHNGLVIAKMLLPIDVGQHGKDQVRELAAHCRSIMEQKITEFDKEVAECETAGKVQVDNLYFCGGHSPARYYFNQLYMEQIYRSVGVSLSKYWELHFIQALFP